jgi:hypothetical protein
MLILHKISVPADQTASSLWQEKTMSVRSRFIKSVIAAAAAENTPLPFHRGAARRKTMSNRAEPTVRKLRLSGQS